MKPSIITRSYLSRSIASALALMAMSSTSHALTPFVVNGNVTYDERFGGGQGQAYEADITNGGVLTVAGSSTVFGSPESSHSLSENSMLVVNDATLNGTVLAGTGVNTITLNNAILNGAIYSPVSVDSTLKLNISNSELNASDSSLIPFQISGDVDISSSSLKPGSESPVFGFGLPLLSAFGNGSGTFSLTGSTIENTQKQTRPIEKSGVVSVNGYNSASITDSVIHTAGDLNALYLADTNLSATGSDITADTASAVVMEGTSTLTADNSRITGNRTAIEVLSDSASTIDLRNGTTLSSTGGALIDVGDDASANIKLSNVSLSGKLNASDSAYLNIGLQGGAELEIIDSQLSKASIGNSSGNNTVTLRGTTLTGSVQREGNADGTLNLNMINSTLYGDGTYIPVSVNGNVNIESSSIRPGTGSGSNVLFGSGFPLLTANGNGSGTFSLTSSIVENLLPQTRPIENSAVVSVTGYNTASITDSVIHTAGDLNALVLTDTNLSATGSDITADTASAVVMEGTSTLTAENTRITGNRAAIEVLSDSASTIDLRNGTTLSSTGNALIDVGDSARTNVSLNNVTLSGDLLASQSATMNVALQENTTLSGNLINANNVSIRSGSQWRLAGDNKVSGLIMNGGTVDFNDNGGFRTLTTGTLSGNGNFIMNTELASHAGDLLNVTGEATGTHMLFIKNTGAEPVKGQDELQVVHTGSGDSRFLVSGGKVDAGTWQYSLAKQGSDWFLVQDAAVDPDPVDPDPVDPDPVDPDPVNPNIPSDRTTSASTDAVLSMAIAPQLIFNSELDNLRYRKGDVRNGKDSSGGVWGRYFTNNSHINGTANSAFRMEQNGMEVGGDKILPTERGNLFVGAFVSFSDNKIKHARGGSSSIDSSSIGIYGTYVDMSGFYLDAVIKGNHFSNNLNARMTDGTAVTDSYSQNGIGGSLETGWTISLQQSFWIEPYARMTAFRAEDKDISLSNEMTAKLGNDKSVQGEVGVNAGKDFTLGSAKVRPYIKAAVAREFVKNNDVRINDQYTFNNDFSGNTGRYGAGIDVQISETANIYAEANYQNGHNIETPVMANAGFRLSF
ncbi:autotransporter outer membrane beta-barrel domain-containing protein [Enterobacter hormaechei]